MRMQSETKKGPGVAAPEPLCIACTANALPPYTLEVIEGNRNAVCIVIERSGGTRCALVIDRTFGLAELPENAL